MATDEQSLVQKIILAPVSEYPYKHFVVTDFLSGVQVENLKIDLKSLEGTVPTNVYTSTNGEKREWRSFEGDYRFLEKFMKMLASLDFIAALKKTMGIAEEIDVSPDFTYDGGGYVISPPGAHLGYHADFNFSSKANSYRVLNVLFYFNEDYKEDFGGVLHLLDPNTKTVEGSVHPRQNTLLCFLTDDLSFHGVSINKPNFYRRSFNIYYYTKAPLSGSQDVNPHKTIWIGADTAHDH